LTQSRATILGILALLFWSSTVAFSRSLAETLGTLTASSCIFLLGGAVACAARIVSTQGFRRVSLPPFTYLVGCGFLFVVYMVCLYVAIGFASDRQEVLEVALINYLWPALTLAFAIPILKKKAQVWLVFGVFLGFVGVFLATFSGESFSWRTFAENMAVNYLPYVFAFVAAVSWALYSNLSRLWGGQTESGGVPLFLLLSGVVFVSLRVFTPEDTRWTFRSMLELVYMMVFPTALGYVFWDEAMRKGRIILVASLSYLTPLLSAIIATVYLGVKAGWSLWIGCMLVVAGAAVCKLSVKEDLEGMEPSTEKY